MSVDMITRAVGLDPDWREAGLCRQTDPTVFFPERGEAHLVPIARRICAECPVRAACLAWALAYEEGRLDSDCVGIWGGLTANERRTLRAEQAGVAA